MNELTATYQQNTTGLPEVFAAVDTGSEKSPGKINGRFFQGLDYYPYGMEMPGRKFSSGFYRYGYQSSEKENEIAGSGNVYTTYCRMLDTRIGRWWTTDVATIPWQSPYCSMDNSPISLIDPWGAQTEKKDNQEPAVKEKKDGMIIDDIEEVVVTGKRTEKTPENKTGYVYTAEDWDTRRRLLSGGSTPITRGLLARERRGEFRPIHDFRALYGKEFQEGWKAGYYGLGETARFWSDAVGVAGMGSMAVPFLELMPLNIFSTKFWGGKAVLSAGSQALLKKGEINIFAVAGDAVMFWGYGDFTGSAFEANINILNPQGGVSTRSIFGSKSFSQFGTEFGTSLLFNSKIKLIDDSILKSSLERTMISLPNTFSNYSIQRAITLKLDE
jgi:hypothetical protein